MLRFFILIALVVSVGSFSAAQASETSPAFNSKIREAKTSMEKAAIARQFLEGGADVKQDDKAAYAFFLLAAQDGSQEAQYQVGLLLRDGRGVAQNYLHAYTYLMLAARDDYKPSKFSSAWYASARAARDDVKRKLSPEDLQRFDREFRKIKEQLQSTSIVLGDGEHNIYYVPAAEANIVVDGFNKDAENIKKFSGLKITSCLDVMNIYVGTANGNISHGGYCKILSSENKETSAFVCNDDLVGHFAIEDKPDALRRPGYDLATFVANHCWGS